MNSAFKLTMVLLGVLASGCYTRASRPVTPEVATRCPSLSGEYFFPGVEEATDICSVLDGDLRKWFRWPNSSRGFGSRRSNSIVSIRQDGCSSIRLAPLSASIKPGVWTTDRDLVRTRQRQEIKWTENSLMYRDRVKPIPGAMFIPLPNAAKETIYFRLEADGALTYRGSYWEATEGRGRVLTECTLPRAKPEDWRAVGLEAPVQGGRDLGHPVLTLAGTGSPCCRRSA